VFENRELRRIYGPKRKWRDAGEDCIMRSFITWTLHHMLLRTSKDDERGNVARMGKMGNVYKIWLENLKGRDHLEDISVDGKILLERMLG
jgi:hypothetical protein